MQKLANEYTNSGIKFYLVKRSGKIAWFQNETRFNNEVFLIKENPPQKIFEREYPARESVPGTESWGINAYSFSSEEYAEKVYNRMVKIHG